MYSVLFYVDVRGDVSVRDFIKDINKQSRAKIGRYLNLLEQYGPDLPRPYADHVREKIIEQAERNMHDFLDQFRRGKIAL